jgi:hypothetical protein
MRIKAAVCREFAKPLSIEEVELAAPGAGEIRVNVAACAICHSDIHYADGAWGGDLPSVYGHEASGTIEEIGAGVFQSYCHFRHGRARVITTGKDRRLAWWNTRILVDDHMYMILIFLGRCRYDDSGHEVDCRIRPHATEYTDYFSLLIHFATTIRDAGIKPAPDITVKAWAITTEAMVAELFTVLSNNGHFTVFDFQHFKRTKTVCDYFFGLRVDGPY